MNTKVARFFTLLLFVFVMLAQATSAEKGSGRRNVLLSPSSPLGTPIKTYFNINNISTVFWNQGFSDIDINDNNSGFVFPKGSRKTAVFKSGFIWGGKVGGEVRVGGSTYRTGLQAGRILANGTASDPDAPGNRIYRVRPDYRSGDLSSEIGDGEGSATQIRAQYELDWNQWPATEGAPFKDGNNDGVYSPALVDPEGNPVDVPGVPGADQTIWYVCNDLSSVRTLDLYGAQPMGLELQVTIFGYAQQGALGNMFFRKMLMINRGTNTIDSMFVSMWSDIDLGDSNDDFAGCDTTLSVGYVYNAFENDATYTPLPPPCTGFDFFQGPVVNSPGDSAIFRGKRVQNKKNLPMTASYYFIRGDLNLNDPELGSYTNGTLQMYNFIRGRIGRTGQIFQDPNGRLTTFALDGNPVTGSGWIDGQLFPAGDRRIGLSSGPFVMVPRDTQEIVVAEIAAGAIPGVNRLTAISLLKFYDAAAQLAYNNFFNVPSPPPAPKVTATETNGEIILVWGSDPVAVAATENSNVSGFRFQGYNVYQFPPATTTLDRAKRVATYDIVDGVQIIQDLEFDASVGALVRRPKQFGTDTGIKRSISIETDALKGNTPLINGIRYYIAVTAYSYNPDPNAIPNNLETPPAIIAVVPHSANPGVTFHSSAGDTIAVSHTTSVTGVNPSEGTANPIVVDPGRVSGDAYQVTFATDTSDGLVKWTYKNTSKNVVLLSKQTNQSGDDDYLIIDGLQLKVAGPPEGMKDFEIPNSPPGARRWTFADADGFAFEGFLGAIGYDAPNHVFNGTPKAVRPDQVRNTLVKLATAASNPDTSRHNPLNSNLRYGGWDRDATTDPNMSYGYRYLRSNTAPPAQPDFAPFIVNATGGYAYQDYKKGVPWSAWNVEVSPPQRLAVGFLENNQPLGMVDGKHWPAGNGSGVINTAANGPREWFFIFNTPYTGATPDPALQVDILNNPLPVMWFGTVNRRGGANYSQPPLASGDDQFLILANHPNTAADVFTFNTADYAASRSVDQAKQDVAKINVFPNPYYGVNTEEINKYQRWVTFTHLPDKATIRIFNLAGILVRTIIHNSPTTPGGAQFERWDLANEAGLPVGSGLYIAHIDMPDLGTTKILKLAIVQEQQVLDRF
jgi:hypothetical protein